MSSSYRKSPRLRLAVAGSCAAALLCSFGVGSVMAADTYVQPQVDLRGEYNDNFDLTPGGSDDSDVYGYIADLQALIGIATQRSDTSIRPRLRFQEYPDRDELQTLEGFLDVRSRYDWERSRFDVLGRYAHQDSYNAEFPGGEFDPLAPSDPVNSSGEALVGETRDRFLLTPEYTYDLTERVRLEFAAQYEAVRYDADEGEPTQTDYDNMIGSGAVGWALNPRSDVSVGAYASKYEAGDDSTETEAYGGDIGYGYRWSDVIGLELNLFYEQNDTTDFLPVPGEESTSNWGGTVTGYWKGEVSDWKGSIGRTYIPTGSGGKAESDQLRIQYDRDLTQRLKFRGAGRYEARTALTDRGSNDDRDYARADLSLQWAVTPTWYVRGGYSYIWQDRESATDSATNNKFFISTGYRGLGRQR